MMRPSELLKHARDRSDKFGQSKVNHLADSISRRGYRASMHNERSDIRLEHMRFHSELTEGNHRIHAMAKIGYDKPVRVRVVGEKPVRK